MKGFKFAYEKALRGRPDLNNGEFKVLIALLTYADADGKNAHPGVVKLAHDCNLGERTVITHLKALSAKGFVTCVARGRGGVQNRSVYDFAMPQVPAKEDAEPAVRASQVPANLGEVHANPRQSTCKSTSEKPSATSENGTLSGPISGPISDPLARTPASKSVDAKEEIPVALLNEMTAEFLLAYPKGGNQVRVKDALRVEMNANGGARHFSVLLAAAKAYAETVRTEGTEQKYIKAPHNFIADGTYKSVKRTETLEDRCRSAYARLDLRFLDGYPYSPYTDYTDDLAAKDESRGNRPADWDKEWDRDNRRRFLAYWIYHRYNVNVLERQREPESTTEECPF